MHTLAHDQVAVRSRRGLWRVVTRYRAFLYFATLLLVAALAFADRRGSSVAAQPVVTAPGTESAVPADANDRPLNLPDR